MIYRCYAVVRLHKKKQKQMMGLLQIQNGVLCKQIFLFSIKIHFLFYFSSRLIFVRILEKKRKKEIIAIRVHTCVFAQNIKKKRTNLHQLGIVATLFLLSLPHDHMYTSLELVLAWNIVSLNFYFYFSSYLICIFNYVE